MAIIYAAFLTLYQNAQNDTDCLKFSALYTSKFCMKTIGIDFGTSNSLAALVEDGEVSFAPFPDGKGSNPTVLYFPPRGKAYFVGNEGIDQHFDDLDEGRTGGRLMFSIKSLLQDAKFDHTTVTGHGRMTAANLVSYFIRKLKGYAEQEFDREFERVVLGRPVDFSENAIARLREAATESGFREIIFCLEPVAAAISYEASITERELVCVVDLGGGTSDICIVEVSPQNRLKTDRVGDIKAVNGVNIAGDELSATILKNKLAGKFGAGSTFTSLGKVLPFPAHIISKLARWHLISRIRNPNDLQSIAQILVSSSEPEAIARLQVLVNENLGYELYKAIERAKFELSDADRTEIAFSKLGLDEAISRREFENGGRPVFDDIQNSIIETLRAASVTPADIGHVLLTGGTAQIPVVQKMVEDMFGPEKVLRPGYQSSVASGLAHVAATH